MSTETVGLDIFMRYTDVDGKTTVRQQRTWDKDIFLAARQSEVAKENARPENQGKSRMATAEQITEAQYLKERK